MKARIIFVLNTIGWLMLFCALLIDVVYSVASDDDLYYKLQMEAGVLDYAGISDADLRCLDEELSRFLFHPMNTLTLFFGDEIEVFGRMQQPFNAKELIHLKDCRKLFTSVANPKVHHGLLISGLLLMLIGIRRRCTSKTAPWAASAIILAPIAFLGLWAAVDFNSAFHFFHKILFTNDLWLLDPRTDLLIRICPASMFAGMGLRIALKAAFALLGLPLIVTMIHHLSERKRKSK